jgi:RecB family endonuclease NucS
VSRQESSDIGRLDLLARDSEGRTVIIELKAGEAKDSSIGQIARYIGWYQRKKESRPGLFSLQADSENRSVGRRKRFLV